MDKTKEKSNNQERIKIEIRYGDHYSYFVDANGLLKGEWGGFDELYDKGPNGEAMFEIYYIHFSRRIPINEFGFFYNKFSCKKYDGIVQIPKCNLYICEKNGRYGIIDENEKIILHTVFNKIEPYYWGVYPGYGTRQVYMLGDNIYHSWEEKYKDKIFFIVTTETGKFLFNLSKNIESSVYDDITFSDWEEHAQIIFKSGGMYGAIDLDGNVILKPHYELPKFRHTLFYTYQGIPFKVWVENGKFYGVIPTTEYDVCFMVGSHLFVNDGCFYISKMRDKYGFISYKRNIVFEPMLDEIILYTPKNKLSNGCLHIKIEKDFSKWIDITYVIARTLNTYRLYNVQNGHLILENCDSINYKYSGSNNTKDFIEFEKDGIRGYVLWNESIISTAEYEDVEAINGFVLVKKEGKFGVLKPSGEELLPCIFDNIQASYGGKFTLNKDGKEEVINAYSRKQSNYHSTYERSTYGRYAGSYAQDEMGWSDDDIDTVLDGDPSAYWNID